MRKSKKLKVKEEELSIKRNEIKQAKQFLAELETEAGKLFVEVHSLQKVCLMTSREDER